MVLKTAVNYSQESKLKSKNNIPNGIISLKGGDLEDELKNFNNYKIFEISDFFSNDFFKTKKIVFIPCSN
jgi:16S rRNA (guanine527-N7)-methyltransferase